MRIYKYKYINLLNVIKLCVKLSDVKDLFVQKIYLNLMKYFK